jgi:SAM-dependent methyltransferase
LETIRQRAQSTIIFAVMSDTRPPEEFDEQARALVAEGDVPTPPEDLVRHVGATDQDFRAIGEELKQQVLDLLPAEWSFEGKRVLDFGCGSGRLLVHFLHEARTCEFHGCDIDSASIEWLQRELSPPMHIFRNAEIPPLPLQAGSLDLIIALSVFTHLSDTWSAWLVEMDRVLAADGLLIATFLGKELLGSFREDWDDDRIGMNVLRPLQGWELGGPMVFHSSWWLREHWGRAFEVLALRERGFVVSAKPHLPQGVLLLRKKPGGITSEELERIDSTEPREMLALRHNVAQLGRESRAFQLRAEWLEEEVARLERERVEIVAQPQRTRGQRLSHALRRLAATARRRSTRS